MPPDSGALEKLRTLVEDDKRRAETECARCLVSVSDMLVLGTPLTTSSYLEVPNFFGKTDFIVAADVLDEQGNARRRAFIWELKAPQCYLFERDDSQVRFRPTKDFVKAENQLLHYANEIVGNDPFRQRFRVMDPSDVRLGGIIIGRWDRLFSGAAQGLDAQNAESALRLRERYLYALHGIRVFTWDGILKTIAVRPSILP